MRSIQSQTIWYRCRIHAFPSAGLIACMLLSVSPPTQADAFRCRSSTGQIVISNIPCGDSHKTTSVVSGESPDAASLRTAQSDLERQKQWLRQREEGQQQPYSVTQSPTVHRPSGDASDHEGRDRIYACLMAVTAKTGLSAYETGQRRVNCYRGTNGLSEECEGRVTGTSGLTNNQEQNLRQQCRHLSG